MARRRRPNAFLAGLRSLVVPGWGQIRTGHPALGWSLVAASLLTVAGVVVFALAVGPVEFVARMAHPATLTVIITLNLVVALFRMAVTRHAWQSAGGASVIGTTVLALLVLLPHAALGYVGWEARAALTGIFDGGEVGAVATTTTTAVPTTAPTTTTLPPTTAEPSTVSSTTTTIPATTTTSSTLPLGTDRLTILLLGGDAGPGRPGLRTDTIMVATIDTVTGNAALFGLPRNWGGFTFSDGTPYPTAREDLLNTVYEWGLAHPDRFGGPNPGAAAIEDVAEHITGLDIDYWALVDLTGFADLVDAFGGVTLDVPRTVDGPLYDPVGGGYRMITIGAGEDVHLSGGEALAYSRARLDSSDYVRMGRQRCVLAAMVGGAEPLSLLTRVSAILDAVERNLDTNIPAERVPDLIRLLDVVDADRISMVGFDRSWQSGWTEERVGIPDVGRIRTAVFQTIVDPSLAAEQSGVLTASEEC